ncbi:hypothetical protein BC939DRAFT_46097 [Gamsiella multidivaricata]|uniref:uncharacterized protein n=1 Tax=Gamsiella multidivaricata TaxID=101098 RepID=UPI002220359A|nr:uncharacterized protein BC939DRAFT_46097 [Gamsiella multidivaricata]KAI7816371.1 hypothetical protein BC939DRAFT_46097 [Gamsiella multidivaricata]
MEGPGCKQSSSGCVYFISSAQIALLYPSSLHHIISFPDRIPCIAHHSFFLFLNRHLNRPSFLVHTPCAQTRGTRNSRGQNHQSRAPKNDEHKDCPRHTEGHPPNRLTTRELGGKRVVSLFYGSDVVLFDTIMTYRLGNPDKRVEDAIDAFSTFPTEKCILVFLNGRET